MRILLSCESCWFYLTLTEWKRWDQEKVLTSSRGCLKITWPTLQHLRRWDHRVAGFKRTTTEESNDALHHVATNVERPVVWPLTFRLSSRRLHLHKKRSEVKQPFAQMVGVSLLKPLKGVDPNLISNLETFFTLDYPKVRLTTPPTFVALANKRTTPTPKFDCSQWSANCAHMTSHQLVPTTMWLPHLAILLAPSPAATVCSRSSEPSCVAVWDLAVRSGSRRSSCWCVQEVAGQIP